MQMGDNDIQGESFYTEFGQIADSGNAQVLANTEANLGRNAALTQENRMVTEYENGGLTEQEIYNEGVGSLLLEKYPDAFEEQQTNDGNKEVILKSFVDNLGRENYVYNKRSLDGLNLSNMSKERADVLFKLPEILENISDSRIHPNKSILMTRILTGGSRPSFSRQGIILKSEDGSGNRGSNLAPDSLKSFSEFEISVFKKVCEFRNEQQRLNKVEKEALEANKMTLDKLRELL